MHTDHRQRPVEEHRDDLPGDGVEVVDEVTLGRPGTVEERLVEICQRDAVALFCSQDRSGFLGMYRSGSGGTKRRSEAWATNRAVVTGFVTQSPS